MFAAAAPTATLPWLSCSTFADVERAAKGIVAANGPAWDPLRGDQGTQAVSPHVGCVGLPYARRRIRLHILFRFFMTRLARLWYELLYERIR